MNRTKQKYITKQYNVEFLTVKSNKGKAGVISFINSLKKMIAMPIEKRVLKVHGEKIRLQDLKEIEFDSTHYFLATSQIIKKKIFSFQFIKAIDSTSIGIADSKGLYNEDELDKVLQTNDAESNKFLATPTICLYDSEKNCLIVSRNKIGTSISEILEFFRETTSSPGLEFTPKISGKNISPSNILKYQNVELSLRNLHEIEPHVQRELSIAAPILYDIITSTSKLSEGINLNGTKGIEREIGEEVFKASSFGISVFNKFKLGVKVEGLSNLETIDFLTDRLMGKFMIKTERGKILKSIDISNCTIRTYLEKYDSIEVGDYYAEESKVFSRTAANS